ncbi:antibiotic biosynthesis monooxygenase [Fischerella thermalis CCMEE 5282]|uniref:putative quinol monooxygenase n=1 Tax=Fischerella thermalis TaxID=372787 RepID=UPI000C7F87E5|nr:putative quinol monooxygenase [Fischerella thermalis]PMB08191.1 antibiotic biosynthesis monooxygenase [Fischerella thermalis CCMEE 5282]
MINTIRVIARITAQPEKVEDIKAVLLEIIEPTRQENGCIKYELLQNQSDPTEFTFVEEWTSNDALDAHLASAHIQTAAAKLQDLVADEIDIRRYTLLA